MGMYNFGAASDKSVKQLNETIKENSKITAKQNTVMIVLTGCILAMTAVMIVLMIVQLKGMR